MTTGRINQVTILEPGPEPGQPLIAQRQNCYRKGGAEAPPALGCRRPKPANTAGPSDCPHYISQETVRRTCARAPGAVTQYSMHLPRGGYHSPVTLEGGYRLGLTPKCLVDRFSHRPLILRLHRCLTAEAVRTSTTSSEPRYELTLSTSWLKPEMTVPPPGSMLAASSTNLRSTRGRWFCNFGTDGCLPAG